MIQIISKSELIDISEQIIGIQKSIIQLLQTKIKEINMPLPTLKKTESYTCQFCDRSFQKKAQLGGHISKSHPQQSKPY